MLPFRVHQALLRMQTSQHHPDTSPDYHHSKHTDSSPSAALDPSSVHLHHLHSGIFSPSGHSILSADNTVPSPDRNSSLCNAADWSLQDRILMHLMTPELLPMHHIYILQPDFLHCQQSLWCLPEDWSGRSTFFPDTQRQTVSLSHHTGSPFSLRLLLSGLWSYPHPDRSGLPCLRRFFGFFFRHCHRRTGWAFRSSSESLTAVPFPRSGSFPYRKADFPSHHRL